MVISLKQNLNEHIALKKNKTASFKLVEWLLLIGKSEKQSC